MTTITFRTGGLPVLVSAPTPTARVRPPGTPVVTVVPAVGPVGPVGPAGGAFSHHQATPAASWLIAHGLGTPREPTVLLDSEPTRAVYPDVEHPDSDTTLITFPEPVTGWAHL